MIEGQSLNSASRKLKSGIVGGGAGGFIGSVHRMASQLDGQSELVAGALSSHPDRAAEAAQSWFLPRSYSSYREMAETESDREDGIDFVMVCVPNVMHFEVAKTFLEKGIHVVCEKPITFTLEEAKQLVEIMKVSGKILAVTHNYTGYPTVRQARAMIEQGKIGDIRKVLVEYLQDWLMEDLENQGQKQAAWRTDPKQAGISNCVGDIGTHGENMLEFMTGEKITSLCADFSRFLPHRPLEDDANILLRLEKGGKGILTCSQIAAGEENAFSIRIYGSKAGLEWHQQEPNTLIYKPFGEPKQILRTSMGFMDPAAASVTRTPAGHPEGYIEAFATVYKNIIDDIRRVDSGNPPVGDYPNVYDGLRGIEFVKACVKSAEAGAQWVDL